MGMRIRTSLACLPELAELVMNRPSDCGRLRPNNLPKTGTSAGRFQSRQGTDPSGIGDQLGLSVESLRSEAAERDPYFAQPGLEAAIVPIFEMHLRRS